MVYATRTHPRSHAEELSGRLVVRPRGEHARFRTQANPRMDLPETRRLLRTNDQPSVNEDRAHSPRNSTIFPANPPPPQPAADGTEKILLQWPPRRIRGQIVDGGTNRNASDPPRRRPGRRVRQHHRRPPPHRMPLHQVGCPATACAVALGPEGLKANLDVGQVIEQVLRPPHHPPPEGRGRGGASPTSSSWAWANPSPTSMSPPPPSKSSWHPGPSTSPAAKSPSPPSASPANETLRRPQPPSPSPSPSTPPTTNSPPQIIPWAEKISIAQLMDAAAYYFEKTGREITFEYIMLDGVNTLPDHARQLSKLAKQLRANVNLIYYNEVPELPFNAPPARRHVHASRTSSRGRCRRQRPHPSNPGQKSPPPAAKLARQDEPPALPSSVQVTRLGGGGGWASRNNPPHDESRTLAPPAPSIIL